MSHTLRYVESEASVIDVDYHRGPLSEWALRYLREEYDESLFEGEFFTVRTLNELVPEDRNGLKTVYLKRRIQPVDGKWVTFLTTSPLVLFPLTGRSRLFSGLIGHLILNLQCAIPKDVDIALVLIGDSNVRLDNGEIDTPVVQGEEPSGEDARN